MKSLSNTEIVRQRIIIAFSGGNDHALGQVWRIVAKGLDFYFEPEGSGRPIAHLSIHAPGPRFSDHRFHVKVDEKAAREQNQILQHNDIPRAGVPFTGLQVADGAYRVARIRWSWNLQRARFRNFSASGKSPIIDEENGDSGVVLSDPLKPNSAWDVDFYASYGSPYIPQQGGLWSKGFRPLDNNAVLGPIRNQSDIWLTGVSSHRSELRYPTPPANKPPLPGPDDTPKRISVGGSDLDGMYWFYETITAEKVVMADRQALETLWPEGPG